MCIGLALRLTSVRMSAPVMRPAAKAAMGSAIGGNGIRNATIVATASEAPADTPINSGPASGLRSVPCMTAPETPSIAPASAPPITRGRRRSRTMKRWLSSTPAEPSRTSATVATESVGVPQAREQSTTPADTQLRTITAVIAFFQRRLPYSGVPSQVMRGPRRPAGPGR